MATNTIDFTTFRESLRYAARLLEEAAGAQHGDEGWSSRSREATRQATLAIEAHLGYLGGHDGLVRELQMRDPRLLPELERHEASLARLLVDVWQFRELPPTHDDGYTERMGLLARRAHSIAND